MNERFKKLLSKITQLALKDQVWLLKQLSPNERKQFIEAQGGVFFTEKHGLPILSSSRPFPLFCETLKEESPLFISIILDVGQFQWATHFITSCGTNAPDIQRCKENKLPLLKPATKATLFKHWQNQLNFSEQLETIHG